MKHEGWAADTAALGAHLPAAAAGRLSRYQRLLVDRGAPMGVIGPGDVERVRERHILDSLRAVGAIGPEVGIVYDLGSGGGLPGIPVAIAAPWVQMTLVEVRRNRAALLRDMIEELELGNVLVYDRRAETLRTRADLVLARAYAPARKSWETAERILVPGGRLLYWAGRGFDVSRDAPAHVSVELFRTPALARSGALAIMTSQ